MDVVYLGADVPLEAWRQTIHDTDAQAVVVAVVSRDDARRATDVIRELQNGDARLVAVGGPSADRIPADVAAIRLPESIEDAVRRLLEAISAGAT